MGTAKAHGARPAAVKPAIARPTRTTRPTRTARKLPRVVRTVATEAQEMRMLAQWLDAKRLVWFHPFNEGRRKPWVGAQLREMGLKSGVPDVVIFSPCVGSTCRGVAIELKRTKGGTLSPQQEVWLGLLRGCGWHTKVALGALDAIKFLEGLGF